MKNTFSPSSRRVVRRDRGFTLIELLVVVAIVAVLASVSTVVAKRVMKNAKSKESEAMATGIALAVTGFQTEYRFLPYNEASVPAEDANFLLDGDVSQFLGTLSGDEELLNFKKNEYLKAKDAKGKKNGVLRDSEGLPTHAFDAFGNVYGVVIDYDGDGEITLPSGGYKMKGGATTVDGTVLVYSPGSDQEVGTRDDILVVK